MAAGSRWVPTSRDMIWIDCNPQASREMKDVHPLLVLSPREFNERTGIVIGLPMTTASYNETNPFAIKFIGHPGEPSVTFLRINPSHSIGEPAPQSGTPGGKSRRSRSPSLARH
jgi:hypothetical protein